MTTTDTQKVTQDPRAQDGSGALAESARRHLAYERLARQVAAGEEAARLVLDALARKQKVAAIEAAKTAETTEG